MHGKNLKAVCDSVSVINSNHGDISYRFSDTPVLWQKLGIFPTTISLEALAWVFPCEYLDVTYSAEKLESVAICYYRRPHDFNFRRLDTTVPTCDRRTDRRIFYG